MFGKKTGLFAALAVAVMLLGGCGQAGNNLGGATGQGNGGGNGTGNESTFGGGNNGGSANNNGNGNEGGYGSGGATFWDGHGVNGGSSIYWDGYGVNGGRPMMASGDTGRNTYGMRTDGLGDNARRAMDNMTNGQTGSAMN